MTRRYLTLAVVAGALPGWLLAVAWGDVGWLAEFMRILKNAFLSALKMIIGPLIFFSLITGILTLGDARRFRSLGLTTLTYYLATTAVAITIGLLVVFVVQPFGGSEVLEVSAAPVTPRAICWRRLEFIIAHGRAA